MRQVILRGGHGRALCAGLLGLALTACGSSGPAADCSGLSVSDAWVRPAHVGSREMTGYFRLQNKGASSVVVNGISSAQFGRAVFQKKAGKDGEGGVQGFDQVTVDVGDAIEFAPNGREVALYSPTRSYDPGDQVELVLVCGRDHAQRSVAAVVRANPEAVSSAATGGDTDADMREQIMLDAKDGGGASASDDSKTAE